MQIASKFEHPTTELLHLFTSKTTWYHKSLLNLLNDVDFFPQSVLSWIAWNVHPKIAKKIGRINLTDGRQCIQTPKTLSVLAFLNYLLYAFNWNTMSVRHFTYLKHKYSISIINSHNRNAHTFSMIINRFFFHFFL